MDATMIGAYIGMFMVLAAFVAETRNIISSRSLTYLLLMAIGEALLTLRVANAYLAVMQIPMSG